MIFGSQHSLRNTVFFLILMPIAQPCQAIQDWSEYVFSSSFEPGDHVGEHEQASQGTLRLVDVDPTSFLATSTTLTFTANDVLMETSPDSVRVFRNGVALPPTQVQVSSQNVVLNGVLLPGFNHIVVLAEDEEGYSLSGDTRLWAGNNTLVVQVRDTSDILVPAVPVQLKLADDPGVTMTIATTASGIATFSNVPPTTIALTATGPGNTLGVFSTTGNAGSVVVRLKGFQPASLIDNNDFSLGLDGWETGTAPVSLIVHQPGGGGSPQSSIEHGNTRLPSQPIDASEKRKGRVGDNAFFEALRRSEAVQGVNWDLMLLTSGIGGQSVSRTFAIAPGVENIRVRYRFITSEVPGGYFGSQYNDNYSISIRTLSEGTSSIASNSMNSLGLGAFDANGATAWYTVTLPVNGISDTLQLDATVTNVGDGDFDSAVVIDFLAEEPLAITSDLGIACPNQTVTFQVMGSPSGTITWSGGGQPATGTGPQFTTRFAQAGRVTIQAQQSDGGTTRTADETVTVWEASGRSWVAQFPTSRASADLIQPFRANAESFLSALAASNANVSISATYRPPERAHLMHYAFNIARRGLDPATVPEYAGVDICWVHRDANGNVNPQASTNAAQAMVNAYAIAYPPALQSRHTQGRAIDMTISWAGDLTIQNAQGNQQVITTLPRTGAGNTDLHAVGAGYGVLKLATDPPHWSDDGR